MPQRDVGRDGGVGRMAFVILMRPIVYALQASISGLKVGAVGRTRDMSVHVLRVSISGLKAAAAGRTELYGINPQFRRTEAGLPAHRGRVRSIVWSRAHCRARFWRGSGGGKPDRSRLAGPSARTNDWPRHDPAVGRVQAKVDFPSVDAPLQARENIGIAVARGRMLSSVRP